MAYATFIWAPITLSGRSASHPPCAYGASPMSISMRWIWLRSALGRSSIAASIAACSSPMAEAILG